MLGGPKTLSRAKPVYETLPGWSEKTSDIQRFEDLPKNARAYLERIGEILGLPLAVVSVGPGREQTIVLEGAF